MELHMDSRELARALATSQVSSEKVFGAAALLPAGCADQVPRTVASGSPPLSPEQQQLLRAAYQRLLGEGDFPEVLDLLGTSDSFVPAATTLTGPALDPGRVAADCRIGLETARHLGDQARLPLDNASFDAVLVTLEVGGLRCPLEVFREVARVLRPQGLAVVSFGDARYDGAHTHLWAHADDREHLMLAEAFIEFAGGGFSRPTSLTLFEGPHGLEWLEGPRSLENPQVAHVHLVFAYRGAIAPAHLASPPFPPPPPEPAKTKDDIRFDEAGRPNCPYCGERMGRYAPPVTIFEIDYGVAELWVCFNDLCGYYRRSRRCMRSQGHPGYTYRFMLNPENGATGPLPDDLWGGLRSCRLD